jgi:hypothetical protein
VESVRFRLFLKDDPELFSIPIMDWV